MTTETEREEKNTKEVDGLIYLNLFSSFELLVL